MKKRTLFFGLFALALETSAHQFDCDNTMTRFKIMTNLDQNIRQEWGLLEQNLQTTAIERDALLQRWRAIDSENLKQLKEIITACGWPNTKKESHSAWLLAQHADNDVAFQRLAEELLESSVKAGVAAPRDLAYLADRIATAEGHPQKYGTQFSKPDRCHLVLNPVDSLDLVNRRRLSIGLQSLEEYEAEARRRFIPSDCSSELNELNKK